MRRENRPSKKGGWRRRRSALWLIDGLPRHQSLMVRSAKRVSNHEATDGPASFETPAPRAPQDEGSERLRRIKTNPPYISELADALLHQAGLDGERRIDGRHRLAHGLVVGGHRLGGNAIV